MRNSIDIRNYVELSRHTTLEGVEIRLQQCLHCGAERDLESFDDDGNVDGYPIVYHVITAHLQ